MPRNSQGSDQRVLQVGCGAAPHFLFSPLVNFFKKAKSMRITTLFIITLMAFGSCTAPGDNKSEKGKEGDQKEEKKKAENGDQEDKEDEEDNADLMFPKPSPSAEVEQQVGITEVEISYSRPSVRGRQIWGKLVPYGKMWRTGANKATSIAFDKPVSIAGKEVEPGKYAIFTIPKKDKWTVIINENADQWGKADYDKSKDVHRFKVSPEETHHHEMMTFHFKNVTKDSAGIVLAWKKTRIDFPLTLETDKMLMADMEKAVAKANKGDWETYYECANYLIDEGMKMDKAEKWLNKSLEAEKNWRNLFSKAELLKKKGKRDKAIETAKKAKKKAESERYKNYIQESIDEWKKES